METNCQECNATGQINYVYDLHLGKTKKKIKKVKSKKTCHYCGGRGKFLTAFGESLIKLMMDWTPWQAHIDDLHLEIKELEREIESLRLR